MHHGSRGVRRSLLDDSIRVRRSELIGLRCFGQPPGSAVRRILHADAEEASGSYVDRQHHLYLRAAFLAVPADRNLPTARIARRARVTVEDHDVELVATLL